LEQQRPERADTRDGLQSPRRRVAPHRLLDVAIQRLNLRREQRMIRQNESDLPANDRGQLDRRQPGLARLGVRSKAGQRRFSAVR
jgi:hypothetical protein